ncbi:MAG: isoprenylcysteine carboxylmethyltransferase family protein [Acidobacteria bacterium]|nr:MAG: isoprenylcysteine carboxylmethyltransferase family protein [Acidobacteriota bacterium]PYY07665.1 MAG: isoprenylcysteine carboxylmethyltransferase family protein [Acidobacteriota bacterium]
MASWSQIARRVRVPLGFGLAVLYFWLAQPTPGSIIAGGCVALVGLMLRGIASGHVTKNQQLTMSGPYAYVRNPLYLGSLVLAAGFAVAARSWVIVIAMAAIFQAVYLPVIRSEESFLRQQFPGFEEYCRHVPRLLPRFTAFGKACGTFSRELYWKHREYNAVLGAALMIAALVAKMRWLSR